MRIHLLRRVVPGIIMGVALVAALAPGAALAHERRTVGDHSFLVGFNNEPAIQGEMNGVQVTVTKPTDNNSGVAGLQNTLKVNVAFEGQAPREFPLTAVSSTPGRYVAQFIPTRA